ncbi:hypothetical protein ACIPYQ_37980 [Streptomyces sp. NPDC090045]|uniref:hypothetical protein n=1 Tax=Streptomyces sp. NPDC090045 TaxID=3365927 RepID=UPI0037F9BB10
MERPSATTSRYGRGEVGDLFAAGRRACRHTVVAVGNWFVWVWPGACAYACVCDMAVVLPAAMVLEPLAEKQEKWQEE